MDKGGPLSSRGRALLRQQGLHQGSPSQRRSSKNVLSWGICGSLCRGWRADWGLPTTVWSSRSNTGAHPPECRSLLSLKWWQGLPCWMLIKAAGSCWKQLEPCCLKSRGPKMWSRGHRFWAVLSILRQYLRPYCSGTVFVGAEPYICPALRCFRCLGGSHLNLLLRSLCVCQVGACWKSHPGSGRHQRRFGRSCSPAWRGERRGRAAGNHRSGRRHIRHREISVNQHFVGLRCGLRRCLWGHQEGKATENNKVLIWEVLSVWGFYIRESHTFLLRDFLPTDNCFLICCLQT